MRHVGGYEEIVGSKHTNQGRGIPQEEKKHMGYCKQEMKIWEFWGPKEEVRDTIPIYKLHMIISSRGTQTKRSF